MWGWEEARMGALGAVIGFQIGQQTVNMSISSKETCHQKKPSFVNFTVLYEDQYRYDCYTCLNILYSRPALVNRVDMVLSARLSPIRLPPALTYKLYA